MSILPQDGEIYCFICGNKVDIPKEQEVGWSDIRKLLGLLCKWMSISHENWDSYHESLNLTDESYWRSQCCGECYSVLIQMEQLNALLERTRESLGHYVKQVETLIVKSEAQSVVCKFWPGPCRGFRECVVQASIRAKRLKAVSPQPTVKLEIEVEANLSDQFFSPEDEIGTGWDAGGFDTSFDENENSGHGENQKLVTPSSALLVNSGSECIPPKSDPNNGSSTTYFQAEQKGSERNYTITPCFVMVEKVNKATPVIPQETLKRRPERKKKTEKDTLSKRIKVSPPQEPRSSTRIAKQSAKLAIACLTKVDNDNEVTDFKFDSATEDYDNDDRDDDYSANEATAQSEDENEVEDAKQTARTTRRPHKSRSSTTKKRFSFVPTKATGRKTPFFDVFVYASENLFLFRQGTFVSRTQTHLVCHAFKCNFKAELSYYHTAFQEFRSHVMEFHRKRKHRQRTSHPCLLCNKMFPNQDTFRKHLHSHHEPLARPAALGADAVCECCIGPVSYNDLQHHMFQHKSEEEKAAAIAAHEAPYRSRRRKESQIAEKKYYCTYENCTMGFKTGRNFRRHLQTHLPPEKRTDHITCDECGIWILRDSLKSHKLRVHHPEWAETVLTCPYCDKKFLTMDTAIYNVHIRAHKGEKPFMCTECGVAYASRSSLHAHYDVKHKASQVPTKCDFCDKVYTNMRSLKHHKRHHHPDMVPRKKLRKVNKLNAPSEDEEGGEKKTFYGPIQRFPCSICDKICVKKHTLKTHLRNVHKIEQPKGGDLNISSSSTGETKNGQVSGNINHFLMPSSTTEGQGFPLVGASF